MTEENNLLPLIPATQSVQFQIFTIDDIIHTRLFLQEYKYGTQ